MALNYTCDDVRDLFIRLSGQFSPHFYKKASQMGIWMGSTPRGSWPDGLGTSLNRIMWERTVASEDSTKWTNAATSVFGSVDGCILTPEIVRFGQSTASMSVQKRYLQTEDICLEDLRSQYQAESFVRELKGNLEFVAAHVWTVRDRDEYIRLSDHKITENASFNIDSTSFSAASPPTSRLLNGTLSRIWDYLVANGAAVDGSTGRGQSGRPVFDLFTDFNTSSDLIKQDPELREDYRFAFMGEGINSPLIRDRGSPIAYNGFRHVYDPDQYRFTVSGGVEIPIPKYKDPAAATQGVKQDINPDWLYAPYARSVVHIPTVYRQLVEATIGNFGGLAFHAVNWMGEFGFKVIVDKKCNPLGNKGFFDATFASASEPGMVQHGFVISHLHCAPTRTLITSCS